MVTAQVAPRPLQQRISLAKAVVTIGVPATASHIENPPDSTKDTILRKGETVVSLAGRQFTIKKQFLGGCESNEGYADKIDKQIRLEADLYRSTNTAADKDFEKTPYSQDLTE